MKLRSPTRVDIPLYLFPNPTPGKFTLTVETPEGISSAEVLIYNMRGERLQKDVLQEGHAGEYTIEEAQAGIYLVRIVAGDRSAIIKVVKK